MMTDNLNQLLTAMPANAFKPYAEYNEKADAITCYFRPDADCSKRLNDHVTVFVSIDSGELVGCRIKGIKGLIEDMPNFIEVQHQDWDLRCIFWSFRGNADTPESREVLKRLAKETAGLKPQLH